MVKRIFGSYNSENDALETVADLQAKGYAEEDLLLLSNKKKQEALEDRTDVEVKSSSKSNGSDGSFMDKVKRLFTQDEESENHVTTREKLIEYGLPEDQAANYAAEVDDGKILIAADEESAGSTVKPQTDPNIDPIDSDPSADTVTGYAEPTEDVPRATAEDPEPSVESTHPSGRNKIDPSPDEERDKI